MYGQGNLTNYFKECVQNKNVHLLEKEIARSPAGHHTGLWCEAMTYGAWLNDVKALDVIVRTGTHIRLNGPTCPLQMAVHHGHVQIVDYLLNTAKVDASVPYLQRLMQIVVEYEHAELMRVLLPFVGLQKSQEDRLLRRSRWRMLKVLHECGRFTHEDPLRLIISFSVLLPVTTWYDDFLGTMEVVLSDRGRAPFHELLFTGAICQGRDKLTMYAQSIARAQRMFDGYVALLDDVCEPPTLSAYAVIESYYNDMDNPAVQPKDAYRTFLFRHLRKARRLWVKAINHVRHDQRLLREQEAAEQADSRHLPGGDAHAAFLAESSCIQSALGKRAREE